MLGKAMIGLYPTPNVNAGVAGASYNYVTEPVRSPERNQVRCPPRSDVYRQRQCSSLDSATIKRWSYAPGGAPAPSLAEGNAFGSNENLINHARNAAIGETHVFSPTTLNLATLGYDRIFDYIASQDNFTCESAKLGIPNANLGCSAGGTPAAGGSIVRAWFPLRFWGYWSLGDRGYAPFQGGTDIYSFKDDLDLIRGKHEIHAGIDLRANQMNVGTEAFQDGFWIVGLFGAFTGAGVCPWQYRSRPADGNDRIGPSMTRSTAAPSPAAAGRSTGPSSRMTGALPRRSPSTSALPGI